jgi:hypothetical protein
MPICLLEDSGLRESSLSALSLSYLIASMIELILVSSFQSLFLLNSRHVFNLLDKEASSPASMSSKVSFLLLFSMTFDS